MGKCTLVLIFYNCLFGLLVLFFRIPQDTDDSLARSDIPPDWCILYSNHIVRRHLDHSDSDCTFSPIRPVCHLRRSRLGSVRIYIRASLLHLSVGQPFRWCFHETLHKCNSLCGFLLRFVGLRHRGGEKLRQIAVHLYRLSLPVAMKYALLYQMLFGLINFFSDAKSFLTIRPNVLSILTL